MQDEKDTGRKDEREIVEAIRAGGPGCEQALDMLYRRHWLRARNFLVLNNASEDDAREAYQECMIRLYEIIQAGRFRQDASLFSFLMAIIRNYWLNELDKRKVREKYAEKVQKRPETDQSTEALLSRKDRREWLGNVLRRMDYKCRKMFVLIYYFEYDMKQVADAMGYENDQVARNKHLRCKKKLKEIFEQYPDEISGLQA